MILVLPCTNHVRCALIKSMVGLLLFLLMKCLLQWRRQIACSALTTSHSSRTPSTTSRLRWCVWRGRASGAAASWCRSPSRPPRSRVPPPSGAGSAGRPRSGRWACQPSRPAPRRRPRSWPRPHPHSAGRGACPSAWSDRRGRWHRAPPSAPSSSSAGRPPPCPRPRHWHVAPWWAGPASPSPWRWPSWGGPPDPARHRGPSQRNTRGRGGAWWWEAGSRRPRGRGRGWSRSECPCDFTARVVALLYYYFFITILTRCFFNDK